MKRFLSLSAMTLTAVCAFALPSLAQSFDRDRNVSVMERPRPEYNALGYRMGAFMAYPAATGSVLYDDNIFATGAGAVDDVIARGTAELSLASTWARHALNFFGEVSHNEYLDVSSETHTDFTLSADGRVDVQRGTAFGGSAAYRSLTEPRTSSSSPGASVEPIDYERTDLGAFIGHERGRVRLGARTGWRQLNFKDGLTAGGAVIDQDFRDRDIWTLTLRSDVAMSPDTALFVEGTYNDRSYRLKPPAVGTLRDSDGYEILVGANFDLTNLIRGEVGVGYMRQSFDNPALPRLKGFGARAGVEWFLTQLTTVSFNAARTAEDSVFAGSSGYVATQIDAGVDHELLRNLIFSVDLAYADDNYKGIDRSDERLSGTLGATYFMNRNIGVTGSYTHLKQNSSGAAAGADYNVNRIGLSVRFQF